MCVSLIVACLGVNGASTITNLVNAQDLAPNFVATLYGVMNFLGTTAGFIAPMLVAHFTSDMVKYNHSHDFFNYKAHPYSSFQNTMEQWKNVFLISAAMYVVSGLIFIAFGSGKVQSWNDVKKKSEPTTESNKVDNNVTYNGECSIIKRG